MRYTPLHTRSNTNDTPQDRNDTDNNASLIDLTQFNSSPLLNPFDNLNLQPEIAALTVKLPQFWSSCREALRQMPDCSIPAKRIILHKLVISEPLPFFKPRRFDPSKHNTVNITASPLHLAIKKDPNDGGPAMGMDQANRFVAYMSR
uniref:Uncharacterized protein n=1 Tax=Glossina pallidipes TaxID=7398 RepID=A0A1A9ZBD8_GLOPL